MAHGSAPAPKSSLPYPPGPRGLPWLGNVTTLGGDPLRMLVRVWREHGDFVGLHFLGHPYVVLNDPDAIHHVVVERHENYPKSAQYDGLRLFLGNGLVTSEGALWKRQRKLAQPAFTPRRLAHVLPASVEATDAMLARWKKSERAGDPVDVAHEMQRVTLRVVGTTLFGIDLDDASEDMGHALTIAQRHANDYVTSLVRLPRWLPTRANREFGAAKSTLDGIVYRILDERRRNPEDRGDLLSTLVAARDEDTNEAMSAEQLRDEIVTLVSAGHETTANALAWTFYLLALHPEEQRRLEREVDDVLGTRAPTAEDLPKLEHTRRVLEESMRLYPPVWGFERMALEEDVVGGYRIPARASVGVISYSLHRHERYWPDPERFDPDRFTDARSVGRPRYAYVPFGAGPRICIGNQFAMMEAQAILARITQRYRCSLVRGQRVEMEPLVTLRPRWGIRMRISAR